MQRFIFWIEEYVYEIVAASEAEAMMIAQEAHAR